MKRQFLSVGLLVLAALVVVPSPVAASSNCAITNVCKGFATVSTTTGGVASTRCFTVRTTNSAPTCEITSVDETTWEMDPGACVTLYYFDTTTGSVPPAVPNKVTIQFKFDNTGTVIRTERNAQAELGNGANWQFCATSTGVSGASARAGTYRIYLQAIKDDGAGGVGNYNVDSDGVATVGAISHSDKGALRGNLFISSVARSAYPAGSTFSFGTAGDEQVTITLTMTQPNGDANVESMRTQVADSATQTVGLAGSSTDVDATTLAQAFTIDQTGFPAGNSPYVPAAIISGSSALTGLKWTKMASTGHGTNIVRDSDTQVHDSTTFNINPDIIADSTGTHSFAAADDMWLEKLGSSSGATVSLFNRGETYYAESYYLNSRGEKLSRSLTLSVYDAGSNLCITIGATTPSSNKYSFTTTVPTGGSCAAANDATGSPRYVKSTQTGQTHTTLATYYVSSLYFVDAHIQLSATLNKDNYPTEDANEDTSYVISTAVTDTTHGGCHVVSVRKDLDIDTSGSVITWSYIDPLSTSRLSGTTDTGSDGWTATHLDLLASTPLGSWTFRCVSASFNGNSGSNDQAFTVSVPAGSSTAAGDPLRITCSPGLAYASDSVLCAISESNADGSGRAGNTAGTLIDVFDPSNTQIVTSGAVTAVANGIYRYSYSIGGSPSLGTYLVVVRTTDASVVASSTAFTIRATPTVYATPSDVSSAQTAINAHTDTEAGVINGHTDSQLATERTTINGHVDSQVASAITSINGHTDSAVAAVQSAILADTTILKTKWGTTDAATILGDVLDLQTKLGTPSDTSSAATVFGKIKLAHEHSDTNDAATQASIATLQTTATTIDTALSDVHTELGAHGKSRTAYKLLEDIEGALASAGLNTTVNLETLQSDLDAHRAASMEIFGMQVDGTQFAQYLVVAGWLIALLWCLRNAKLLAAAVATIGIPAVFLVGSPISIITVVFLFAIALWLEATAKDKLYRYWMENKQRE